VPHQSGRTDDRTPTDQIINSIYPLAAQGPSTDDSTRADDPVTSALPLLFAALHERVGEKKLTAGDVKALADERDPLRNLLHPDMQEALRGVAENRRGKLCARERGKFLGRHKGRVVDGLKLEHFDDTHSKQKVWKIVGV
jgi:hypothetical protein